MKKKKKSEIKYITLVILTLITSVTIYLGIQRDKDIIHADKNIVDKVNAKIDEKNQKDKAIFKTLPIISCWGDGLTAGTGGDGITYPRELSILSGLKVYNYGAEDENTNLIASRQGAIPIYVKKFTIPANKEPVEITLYNQYKQEGILNKTGVYGVNPCEIDGVKGTISYDQNKQKMYFTRLSSGKEVKVEKGTQLFTNNMLNKNEGKNEILVIFTGNNDTSDIDSIISNQRKMINYADTDKYIIIGLTSNESYSTNSALAEEYGDNFLNIKKYLIQHGLEDAKIKATKEDEEDIENSEIPSSLISGGINGNSAYYKIVAQQVLKKIIELEYLNDDQIEYLGIKK